MDLQSFIIKDIIAPSPNTPPTASSVTFSGTIQDGETLTGAYTYADADSDTESGSTFKWYASTDSSGSGKTAISGATSKTFTLTSSEVGKYISFEVTPKNANGIGSVTGSSINSTTVASSNQAPTVSGAEANQAVNDNATIKPFAGIILGDGDGDNISVESISLNNNAYGTLSASSVGTGTVASVQATLRDIIFTPADNRKAVGDTEMTRLTIRLNDGTENSTPNNGTTVVSTSVNDAPTNITLSKNNVTQSTGEDAQIGILSSTDVDVSDTFTYALVGGDGSTNNSSFNINSANLRANNSNTLGAGTYNIRIQTTDASSATYSKAFTITITDDIAPTLSTLSPADDATAVAVDSDLVITLSKDVVVDYGTIFIKKTSDDAIVETISASSGLVSISGAVVTINPDTNLDFNTEYYIQIDNTAFKDASDNYYAGISDKTSWSFTTVDAFTVSKTTASVSETGSEDTFTVVLNSQPTTDVVFNITSADTEEATVSPDTLTFTTDNWDTAQTVTLTGEDDSVFDGSQDTTVTISIDSVANKSVTVTTTDDDSVGITLDKSSLNLAENGGSDTFTITLNTTPTDEVTVQLTTTDNCTLSTTSVVLDSMSEVEVTVTAVDDNIDNATDRTCTINTGDPTSADSNYGDLLADDVANVSVTITDNDSAGFTLSKITASVSESGTTDSFTVVLNSQPETDVVFNIASADTGEVSLAPDTLTFTTDNWNTAQTITISGIDDSIVDGSQSSIITVSVNSSSDDTFDNLSNKTVTVTTTDDDVAPIVTPPASGGGGSTSTPTTPTPEPEEEETVEPIVEEEKVVVQPITEPIVTPIVTPIVVERQTGNAEGTGTKPELDNVTRLYIATFGRAPESAGSVYWLYESKLNLEDIARSFFDQEETKGKYPEGFSTYDFIVAIYNHVYGRDPDQAGGDYWLEELDSGKIEKALFILAVINGAIGDDALMLDKQTIAGVNFVKSGVQNLDMAKKVIDDVK